jgi:steroid 5-alpha reductase family enzyme
MHRKSKTDRDWHKKSRWSVVLQQILEYLHMAQGLRTFFISMAVVAAFASSVAQATPYRCDPNDPNYNYDSCQRSSPSHQ